MKSLACQVEHVLPAHAGGLECMQGGGDLLATCGYGMRMGQAVAESVVKVGGGKG